jgi:putative OPT family oligopeptide transporter
VASYIVGLVGNSNSPVSGMTITAVLFTGAMLWMFQMEGEQAMVATLGVAAIVCCVACTSGDVCNDLKTGQLVGASPRNQQFMQILGVGAACLVMAPVLQLLHESTPGGIGGKELPAPQAKLFAALAEGFFGDGKLPWDMVGVGAVVGLVILAIDHMQEAKGAAFRAHLMPIAVGIYLPFELAPPILVGGVIAWLVTRNSRNEEETERRSRPGMLFASGAIAGEALVGVGLAILTSVGVVRRDFGLSDSMLLVTGSVAFVALSFAFYRASQRRT